MTAAVIILVLLGVLAYTVYQLEGVKGFIALLFEVEPTKSDSVIRGEAGELKVNGLLGALPHHEYTVYPNLYVPSHMTKERPLSEVDHVVVSCYGVFVIETKNLTGEIDALGKWKYWHYVGGKGTIYNPIWQNKGHIDDLATFLDLKPTRFHSLIFFINENQFKRALPPNAFNQDFWESITSRREPLQKPTQVEQINGSSRISSAVKSKSPT